MPSRSSSKKSRASATTASSSSGNEKKQDSATDPLDSIRTKIARIAAIFNFFVIFAVITVVWNVYPWLLKGVIYDTDDVGEQWYLVIVFYVVCGLLGYLLSLGTTQVLMLCYTQCCRKRTTS